MHWSLRAPWKNLRSSQLLGGSKKQHCSALEGVWLAVSGCHMCNNQRMFGDWSLDYSYWNYTQIDFGKAIWNVCHWKVINTAIHLLHCAHVTWLLGLIRDNTRPMQNRKLLRKIKDTFWLDAISDHILGREHFNILHGRQVVALCGFWSKIFKCLFEILQDICSIRYSRGKTTRECKSFDGELPRRGQSTFYKLFIFNCFRSLFFTRTSGVGGVLHRLVAH